MKTRWKKSIIMLLFVAVLTSLFVVPAQAATTQMSYGYTLKCQYADRFQTFVSRATCTIQVPRGATKEEILKLIEDWVEDNVVIDQYDLHFGSLKDCVIRSESCWDPDYKDCVILYVGGGSVWAHNNRYLLTDPLSEDYPIPGTCMFDNAPYCAGDIQDSRVLNPFDESYRQDLIARGQKIAGLNITYAGRRYRLETSRSTIGSWGSAGDSRYFSTRYGINHYYVRDPIYSTVSYQLTGSVPPGIAAPASAPQADGEYTAINAAATAAGYDFSGWSTADTTVSGSGFTMPTHNVTFTGSYTPRTDTPYTVKFYVQNANDNGYTEQTADTVTSKGTTDTQIRAALDMAALDVKYPHCHLTDASKADTTVISGDGTAALSLYYDRQTSNVSYIYSGAVPAKAPSAPAAALQKYGASVSVAASPTLSGYDFSGWSSPDAIVANDYFTMPDGPVTLVGSWSPRTDTPYIVERYKQNADDDGYTLADTDHCIGTTDAVVTAPEKSYAGFTVTPGSMANASSMKIAGDGTTTVKLYYDRNINAVSYTYSSQTDVTPPSLPAVESYRYGQTVVLADNPALAGYDFGGWSASGITIANDRFTMPDGPVTLSGSWIPRTDTAYTIEYYQQNTDDNGYTLADTTNCTGTTGSVATLPGKGYPGFAVTTGSLAAAANVKIKSDGSSTVKLYYDRHVNTVTYGYSNGTDATPPALPETVTYRYGQTVSVDVGAPVLPGYDFSGWETMDAIVTDGQFTMPDAPVALIGAWTPRSDTPFTVEYYQQNATDDGYTLADTFHGEGYTGGGIPHKEFEGYTETPDSVTAEGIFKIKSDGTGILKLYFDRAICSVTYAYTGETDATPPALPETFTYRYGQTVSVDAGVPVLPGYEFSGWKTADVEVTDGQFSMPDKPVTFTGTWKARSDVAYTVEFYQQNIADDGYTLADTFHGEGTAGGNIPLKEFEGFLLTPDSVTAAGSFKIRSDGTATLKLYYDRERFTVTYAYAGRAARDSVPEDAPALPETTSYRYGQTVTLPAQPQSKSALRFLGWALDGTLTNVLDFVLEKDVTITGYWYTPASSGGDDNDKPAYSAVLIPDSAATDIVLRGDSSNRVTFLEPPEKDGCTFAGWATESGGDATYHAGDTITLTRNCVFYAVYYRQIAPYIIGFKDDTFRPCSNLTLKQGALMLNRLGVSTQITSPNLFFTRRVFLSLICTATGADIRSQDPVDLAAQRGWIVGFKDGTLRPDDYITRAQAATILDRVFRQENAQVKDGRSFADIPQSHWANEAISRASATSTIRV